MPQQGPCGQARWVELQQLGADRAGRGDLAGGNGGEGRAFLGGQIQKLKKRLAGAEGRLSQIGQIVVVQRQIGQRGGDPCDLFGQRHAPQPRGEFGQIVGQRKQVILAQLMRPDAFGPGLLRPRRQVDRDLDGPAQPLEGRHQRAQDRRGIGVGLGGQAQRHPAQQVFGADQNAALRVQVHPGQKIGHGAGDRDPPVGARIIQTGMHGTRHRLGTLRQDQRGMRPDPFAVVKQKSLRAGGAGLVAARVQEDPHHYARSSGGSAISRPAARSTVGTTARVKGRSSGCARPGPVTSRISPAP